MVFNKDTMEKLDKYKRMRISEDMDECGVKDDEISDVCLRAPNENSNFVEEYKKKYSDIKTSLKEDW